MVNLRAYPPVLLLKHFFLSIPTLGLDPSVVGLGMMAAIVQWLCWLGYCIPSVCFFQLDILLTTHGYDNEASHACLRTLMT